AAGNEVPYGNKDCGEWGISDNRWGTTEVIYEGIPINSTDEAGYTGEWVWWLPGVRKHYTSQW
ncbi:MAG: hypothetical protein ACE5MB_09795, partial [Anaerolineae bacterium]